MAFGLLIRQPTPRGACHVRVRPRRSRRRAGSATGQGLHCSRWPPRSSGLAHGQEQDLPGSLTIHPVTLRRSTTPDDPSRLAYSGRFLCCPRPLNTEGVIDSDFEASSAASSPAVYASRRALPRATQDSLPAGGLRLAGRESNPLDRYERFQFNS